VQVGAGETFADTEETDTGISEVLIKFSIVSINKSTKFLISVN